ncbi:MAG: TatD family hydrolase [Endomicrobium sp.]|jgi:TatD DNase family protein|nr:TatD family hydrolase [Endomicrobium sp.]
MVDTHTHLLDSRFNNDRENVIQRAYSNGILSFFEIACDINCWDQALDFSKRENVFISLGIHPTNIFNVNQSDYNKLQTLIRDNDKCIAVGEIGLDYHYHTSLFDKKNQKENFIKQLEIALKYNKRIIIHCRDAYDDMIYLLKEQKNIPKGIIHCFLGNLEESKFFTEAGFLLGINGLVTLQNSKILKQIILKTNLDKIVIETDCPYLTPKKYKNQRNEPSYMIETIKEVAIIKNISISKVAKITTKNALDFLK